MPLELAPDLMEHLPQGLAGVGAVGNGGGHEGREEVVENGVDQGFLGGEMPVDRRGVDAQSGPEGPHGEGGQAVLVDELGGGLNVLGLTERNSSLGHEGGQ